MNRFTVPSVVYLTIGLVSLMVLPSAGDVMESDGPTPIVWYAGAEYILTQLSFCQMRS